MKVYNTYTGQEKTDYKIGLYTRDLCKRIDVVCSDNIVSTIIQVMALVKRTHGSKRLKIKDAIIIVCIAKILDLDPIVLAKRVNIENKYIYNTQKLFVDIPELKQFISSTTPFEYVKRIYENNKKTVSHDDHLVKVARLIEFCEENNILSENSSMSIGVTCLYNTLINEGYEIDIKKFSKMYNLSTITILKTNKKLTNALLVRREVPQ